MARSYRRDAVGRFAGGKAKGDAASTVQQERAEHSRERKAAKSALSGGRVGGRKAKRVNRNRTVGQKATNRALQAALARAKRRFA